MSDIKNSFKDKCDICKEFDYLVSVNNQCLCSKCRKDKIAIVIDKANKCKQLSIFDKG